MKTVGRLLVREGKIAGVFIPYKDGLKSGIYEVQEILGELTIRYIGQPQMSNARYQALDLNHLLLEAGSPFGGGYAGLTKEEVNGPDNLPGR